MSEPENVYLINREDIRLYLTTNKETFIRAESINLTAYLFNTSPYTIKVEDFSASNNSLQLSAINSVGEQFSGSLISPRMKDGLTINEVREKTLVPIQPKSSISIEVNLLSILGELPEGFFEVKGTYTSGLIFIDSAPVPFKIIKSTPIKAKTAKDYLRTEFIPIRTAWINKEENVFYLFLMENSQYQPANLRSNHKIIKISDTQNISPSITVSPDLQIEHLIWIEKGTIKIAALRRKSLIYTKEIMPLAHNFQILEPAITDFDGSLHFVIASKEHGTTRFQLAGLSLQEEITNHEVCTFDGEVTKYSIVFDEDLKLHLAWLSESGDIFYSWFCTDGTAKMQGSPKMLAKGLPPILDLQLSKAYRDKENRLQLILNFVASESSTKLHSKLLNVENGQEILHSYQEFPELEKLQLLQTVLDFKCKPHFLFYDCKGALWFKSSIGGNPVKVTQEDENYPDNIDYPMLLVSSSASSHYGVHLRYIKDKSKFQYKEIQSLT